MESLITNLGTFLAGDKIHAAYWCLAIFGTLFFAIVCLLTIFGLGGLDGTDFDADGVAVDHLDTGYLDFNMFSIRSILAFATVFGWAGVIWGHHGIWGFAAAFVCGLITQVITALIIWGMMKLQSSGTISNQAFIGATGSVYIGIPAGRTQPGKITVSLNGATHELRAVSDEAIPTGSQVVIEQQVGDHCFSVKKIS